MTNKLLPHEKAGRVIILLAVLIFLMEAGIAAAILLPKAHGRSPELVWYALALAALVVVIPALLAYLGFAVKRHEPWARVAGIIYAIILLPGFPVGTIAGGYILWCLLGWWDEASTDPTTT